MSEDLYFDVAKNIINANKNVTIENKKNYKIFSDQITYFKDNRKIVTKGKHLLNNLNMK